MPSQSMPLIGEFACLEMKMIGKPYAGELQVRFDEGEQDFFPWTILNGHEVGNDRYGQGSAYRMLRLFSTLPDRLPVIVRSPEAISLGGEVLYGAMPIATCWNDRLHRRRSRQHSCASL
jgi:hypothetical protein